jgi:hypothetical protein
MKAAGLRLVPRHCKHHVEHKARHGSYWHPSYRANDLKPYLQAATSYISPRLKTNPSIANAVDRLAFLIAGAPYEQATRLRGVSATTRADIAFGRFRKRGIKPERLLAIYIAITALIREDPRADRTKEFRIVQVAKAAHRLASGYHRIWTGLQDRNGRTIKTELHAYARSTGRVLRILGKIVEERCEEASTEHLDGVLALKIKRYGRHPRARR